jgi:hypothetical protein
MIHVLSHGLGRLEDRAGAISQLGFLVQDHEHLRSLLVRCEPENRSSRYDSLKPYLGFKAKPLAPLNKIFSKRTLADRKCTGGR